MWHTQAQTQPQTNPHSHRLVVKPQATRGNYYYYYDQYSIMSTLIKVDVSYDDRTKLCSSVDIRLNYRTTNYECKPMFGISA